MIWAIIILIATAILLVVAKYERRTLWFGALAVFWLAIVYAMLIIGLELLTGGEINNILFIILIIPIISLMTTPFLVVATLIFNGIRVIRREGFKLAHCVALACGIGTIVYVFLWPFFINITENTIANRFFYFVSSCVVYFVFTFFMYLFATIANFINLPQKNLDYIIVLGAGLNGERVTPLLASRINRAIALLQQQPATCQLIMSGGQGADEVISEAEAMTRYAIEQGVNPQRMIREDKSTNTYENIEFSYRLMNSSEPKVAVVTNYYHLFRALIIARKQKRNCIGFGARTKFYYTVNAYIREYIGYLSLTRNRHMIICSIILLLHIIDQLIK